jgi:hypothetical protein
LWRFFVGETMRLSKINVALLLTLPVWLPQETWAGQQPASPVDKGGFAEKVVPFLKTHCIRCHGSSKQAGKFRLDQLLAAEPARGTALESWHAILERLATGEMPPKGEPRPDAVAARKVIDLLHQALKAAGSDASIGLELAYPHKGNSVDHDLLFGDTKGRIPGGDPRLWRITPFAYRGIVDGVTHGKVKANFKGNAPPVIPTPFGLSTDHGFRDYAFRYKVSTSEIEQLALNAKKAIEYAMKKRGGQPATKELAAIANATGMPSAAQIDAAVNVMFQQVLSRPPTKDERERYGKFLAKNLEKSGNQDGLIRGLTPVLLHPEAIFRLELAEGEPDEHGRKMLAPQELARALAYALTDLPPDATLLAAARNGKLKSADDVRREVKRMLEDADIDKPRILRFFQEYFDYTEAPDVFKDDYIIKAAAIGKYNPTQLVNDTDALVLHILANDRAVLFEMLTTKQAFVDVLTGNRLNLFRQKQKTSPFTKDNRTNEHYNLTVDAWKLNAPVSLPADQRAGILTQPSWLIAFSTNTDNHAILRGKWVRERLLGGQIPDTPVTVDAQLPEEPAQPLRHRMRVTRAEFCWKCHERMDPLGLTFQIYDGFGRYRKTELGKPVDASGAIVDSGDAKIDGPVKDALEMIHKLAKSERVEQVFVRHAFRYWMGRNETLDDAPTLQAAHKAYRESNGSMRALILALLSSESFLYRRVASRPANP